MIALVPRAAEASTTPPSRPASTAGQHVMAGHAKTKAPEPPQQSRNDLKDWLAIGMIVAASSLLVWAPLLI